MKWIPINNESLPDSFEPVLILTDVDTSDDRIYVGYLWDEGNHVEAIGSCEGNTHVLGKPTHWIKLPEFPKDTK